MYTLSELTINSMIGKKEVIKALGKIDKHLIKVVFYPHIEFLIQEFKNCVKTIHENYSVFTYVRAYKTLSDAASYSAHIKNMATETESNLVWFLHLTDILNLPVKIKYKKFVQVMDFVSNNFSPNNHARLCKIHQNGRKNYTDHYWL